ncbi:hypothetical protein [Limibacillus halophilus]|jgi:PAS domain-containing protein
MIKIAKQMNLNALFMGAVCIGIFFLGLDMSSGGMPDSSLFLLPICLAWLGRDPRALKMAIVGALLLLGLIWASVGFDFSQASLLQWSGTAFLIVFLGGGMLEALHLQKSAEQALTQGQAVSSMPKAVRKAAPPRRLPANRSLSASTLQDLLDRIEGAAFLFDADLRLILANQEAEAFIAFARPGAEVKHAGEFLPDPVLDLLYGADEERFGGETEQKSCESGIVGKQFRFSLEKAGRNPLLIAKPSEEGEDRAVRAA